MSQRLAASALLLALSAGLAVFPQVPSPKAEEEETTIRVDVDLVNVLFAARNRQGGLVANLTKDDFTLFEDGKQQTVANFTTENNLPLTIGLLVDVSGSQRNLIDIERRAAAQFFRQVLRPKDMAFLISFGSDAELLQDYTNSPKLLESGLADLRVSSSPVSPLPGPVPTMNSARGTVLFDAVYLAANEKLKGEVGRKAVIIITDGVDMGSRVKLGEAVEAAHKSDTIIYSIQYIDPGQYGYFGGGGDGDLRRMSEDTGGRMFRVDRKQSLEDILAQIDAELRSQYSLAYTSSNPKRDGGFRRIEIKPRQKDLKVQARKGYYASGEASR